MPKAWMLTRQAETGLKDIAVWTVETFSRRQADAYAEDLIDTGRWCRIFQGLQSSGWPVVARKPALCPVRAALRGLCCRAGPDDRRPVCQDGPAR